MKLFSKCKKCRETLSFRSGVITRMEYEKKYGETKKIVCDHCASNNEIHIDDFRAKTSNVSAMIAVGILIVGTPIMCYVGAVVLENYFVIGGFLLIPAFVYGQLHKQEQDRLSMFNRLKVGKKIVE